MKNIISILSIILFISCKEYKNVIKTEFVSTDLPVEVVFYNDDYIDNDTIMLGISVPQKLKLKSEFKSPKVLRALTFAYKNEKAMEMNLGNKIFMVEASKKKFLKNYKIPKDYEGFLNLYVTYKILVPKDERKEIIKKWNIQNTDKNKYGHEIYNIGNIEMNKKFLNKNIANATKGYIRFHINDPDQDKGIIQYVSINF